MAMSSQTLRAAPDLVEHVVLLDPRGRPCGTAPKAGVHGADTPLHLAFSCHVVRRDGAVLLTRRALDKPTWPGVWTNGCCGHPQLGETLRSAVTRRLAQELGVRPVQLRLALPDFTYRAAMGDGVVEHELCPVVVALVDDLPVPDAREVADVAWTTWPELVSRAELAPASLSPWCVEQVRRLALLAPSLPELLAEDALHGAGVELRTAGAAAVLDDAIRVPRPAERLHLLPDTEGALAALRAPLAAVLDGFLAEQADDVDRLHPALAEVTGAVRSLVDAGGKRLRPAFVYWGHRATGAEHDLEVLRPAAAVELLHTFALLHDDVMDRSATRRGRPSAHAALADQHRAAGRLGDSDWFGTSAAILAGDLTYVWADELFDRTHLPAPALARARRVFTELRTEVIAGQYLDLHLAADAAAEPEDALLVAMLKSARYTVTRPLLLGAALAEPEADPETLAALRAYGDAVGLAFQMRDDILGLFGDPSETGKSCLDDLHEGKRTLLVLRALHLADEGGRALLRNSLGDPTLDEARAEAARRVVAASGALASVEALLATQRAVADAALQAIPEPARTALTELAALATERRA
jgi:isopentenyl-diphosphate delta-isomerase type 1